MRISIIVGGTGYYIDALVGRITLPHVPPNQKLRARLEKKSAEQLFALLQKKDPWRARAMNTPSERHNKRRLIRALEIASARPRAGFVNPNLGLRNPDILWIGIVPPLKILEKKIARRTDAQMKKGMVAEAVRLHRKGLSFKRMEELGLEYRSLARFLQKKITKDEMLDELGRDIRRYAKKQLVYWKRNREIHWFDPRQKSAITKKVRMWLKT